MCNLLPQFAFHFVTFFARLATALSRSNLAILAPHRTLIRTLEAIGCSAPVFTASSASTTLSSSRNGVAAHLRESRVLFAAVN